VTARERLRAYLEQRRELGESELTLDALDVEDVMRMLGALHAAGADASPAERVRAPESPPRQPPPQREPRAADAVTSAPSEAGAEWRDMMRQVQSASPQRPQAKPEPPPVAAPGTPVERKPGVLRVDGVFPIGLRVERPMLNANAAGDAWQSLQDVVTAIAACTACGLAQTATRPVPGVGNPTADVLVVGEAPGEQEDLRGEPFVGPAGELLNKILGAIQLERSAVYICNVLKHRPPGNRNPLPDEVRACAPYLQRQIDLVQPRLILAFGTFAAQSLLGTTLGIGKLRQQLHWYQGIPLVATYHPAALLRNEAWKRPTWEDLKLARRILDATIRA
jgi:uracil-DNA glycosylase